MRRAGATVLAALALAGAAAPEAQAGKAAQVCVFRAPVHDTPRGIVVGYLYDGARVHLLGRTANKRWYRIKGPLRLAGWMRRGHVCR